LLNPASWASSGSHRQQFRDHPSLKSVVSQTPHTPSMWTARNPNNLRRRNQVVSQNVKRPARPSASQLTTGQFLTTQMLTLGSALGRRSRSESNLTVIW